MAEEGDFELLRPEGHDSSRVEVAQIVSVALPADAGQRPGGLGDGSRHDGLKIPFSGFGEGGFERVE